MNGMLAARIAGARRELAEAEIALRAAQDIHKANELNAEEIAVQRMGDAKVTVDERARRLKYFVSVQCSDTREALNEAGSKVLRAQAELDALLDERREAEWEVRRSIAVSLDGQHIPEILA